ncbi:MAG: DeoR/GlpR family DNA-binding transcription regulator [Planctomycetota bacterium]
MIALQRHRNILGRVLDEGSVRVTDLARQFEVTEETIRRDLRLLAEQGVVARTHGGAVAVEPEGGHRDLPYVQRETAHTTQKDAIARAAVRLIEPGSVVALDPSTTCCQLARRIPDVELTVVTNSLAVCSILADRPRVEVICTGGTLDAEAMAFFGLHTRRALEGLHVERLFFSCRGLDFERGLSEANDRHAAVKLAMIESAHRCTLLADTSKLGLASTVFYAPAGVAEHLIVNEPYDQPGRQAINRLRKRGLTVDEADALPEPQGKRQRSA